MTDYDPELDQRLARLKEIRAKQAQYPGRRPGGSGLTGLLSTDAQGWSDMLNEQIEGKNIENELRGRPPMTVQAAPYKETSDSAQPLTAPQGIAANPEWWLQGEAQPTEVTADTAARIRQNLDIMPPSLRGLYAERFLKPRQ